MELRIKNIFKLGPISLAAFLTFPQKGVAYYCDHNLCGIEQYCCGDNLCCDYVYSLWYFWVGVALLVLIISACGGFYRYFYDNQQYRVVPYFQSLADNDKSHTQYLVNKDSFNAQDSMDYSRLPPDSRHLDNKSHPPFRSECDKKSYMFV